MVNDVRIFEDLIRRTVDDQLVIVMVDGRTDDICFLIRCQTEFIQDLSCQIGSFVRMIIIAAALIGMEIMKHSCHRHDLRIMTALLRNHGRRERDTVQVHDRAVPLVRVRQSIKACIHISSEFF